MKTLIALCLCSSLLGADSAALIERPETVVLPVYDAPAKHSGDTGQYFLTLYIYEDGTVSKVEPVSKVSDNSWDSLSRGLLPALRAWKYPRAARSRRALIEVNYELVLGPGQDVSVFDPPGRVYVRGFRPIEFSTGDFGKR